MISKNKTVQKLISSLLIISMLTPALVLFSAPKKANAVLGIGDIVIDPVHIAVTSKIIAMEILKQYLMAVVRKLLNKVTQSTINWINTGHYGNPFYVENPKSFFKDIANSEIRNLVDLFGYNSLKYPFGKDFALNTINSYKRQLADNAQYSLSKVIQDPVLLESYRSDFNVGGWNGFLINTQYPQNNYIGFQMLATEEAARRLQGTTQNAAQKVQTALDQASGFLSPQACPSNPKYNNAVNEFKRPTYKELKYEPPTDLVYIDEGVLDEDSQFRLDSYNEKYDAENKAAFDTWAETNDCPKGLVATTPGAVVGNQIGLALGSKIHQAELGAALGNSLSAIFDALINKFLSKGLNALTDNNYQGEPPGKIRPGLNTPEANDIMDDFLDSTNDVADKYADSITIGRFGKGGQCVQTGNLYEGDLRQAIDAVLAANPDGIADKPNLEDANGFKANGKEFMRFVAQELQSNGLNATAEVLNGNSNPNKGEDVGIWKEGDAGMERYEALAGGGTDPSSAKSIRNSISIEFSGFIPLGCTPGGGSKDCGCKTTTEETPEECAPPKVIENNVCVDPTSTTPGSAKIDSISPTTATAGVTTITINGSNLTNQVSFYDSNGGRNTVVGTVNSAKTQTTVLVPASQPAGNATVKIYQGNQIWSNGIVIAINNTGSPAATAEPSFEATTGWGGSLAYNPTQNNWLVVSGLHGVFGRIMDNDGKPVTDQFTLDPDDSGVPKVAFAPDINKYLVVWMAWGGGSDRTTASNIFGRFVNPDGTFSGSKFLVHSDNWPSEASFFSSKSILRYDSKNKKFVLVWEIRTQKTNSSLVTISSTGVVGPWIKLTDGLSAPFPEDGRGGPAVAVSESNNEYCAIYTRGYSGNGGWVSSINARKVNASTGALGPETTIISGTNTPFYTPGIVYNTVNKKYLVDWGGPDGTKGRFMSSCNGSVAQSTITLNPTSSASGLAYNPKSNQFASIGQDADSGNSYVILDSVGRQIKRGLAFTGGSGNFVPTIEANSNDGTFAATSAINYSPTRFAPKLGITSGSATGAPMVTATVDLGDGAFPDVAWYNNRFYVAYRTQSGVTTNSSGNMAINLYSFNSNLGDQRTEKIIAMSAGAGGFPRMTVFNNTLWLAYRDGEASGEDIKLWRQDTNTTESLGPGAGNDPVALGSGYIAWQKNLTNFPVYRRSLTGGTEVFLKNGEPTGISRILSNGTIKFISEDRNAVSWGVSAWFAGDLIVATDVTPHDDNGIVGRFNNSAATEFNIWLNQRAHNPHAATDGNGTYVVATWNPTVRVAMIKK